jgi:hypothetical protein
MTSGVATAARLDEGSASAATSGGSVTSIPKPWPIRPARLENSSLGTFL